MDGFHDFHTFSGFTHSSTKNLCIQPTLSSEQEDEKMPVQNTEIVKKKRGRPRRVPSEDEKIPGEPKRGRPRKVALVGEKHRKQQQKTVTKWKSHSECHLENPRHRSNSKWQRTICRFTGQQINTSKVYLPKGWKCFVTRRSTGMQTGSLDIIYFTPNEERLRSRRDVARWVKKHNSDIDPHQVLFTRSPEVLFAKENAKNIIFRIAGPKGKSQRYLDKSNTCGISNTFNTVFTEGAKELLLGDGGMMCESETLSSSKVQHSFHGEFEAKETFLLTEQQTPDIPKEVKNIPKPSVVPLDKKLNCLKNSYFALKNHIPTNPVSSQATHASQWIPPRSPYNLIQEDLYHNPWQLLIATILLNCTTGRLAIPVIHEFLAKWPSPNEACSASLLDILEVVDVLGFGRTRAATIIRFSHEYLTLDWKKPTELFGIGEYGNDSYKVFCLGQWRTVESEDKYLNLYIDWLHNACSRSSNAYR